MGSIFTAAGSATALEIIWCSLVSIGAGIIFTLVYKFTTKQPSNSFAVSLVMLPLAVQAVILIVNNNLGAGVAVAGAFALVRFRSVPASAKEITLLFSVMAVGIATGMGYIAYAGIITGIMSVVYIILSAVPSLKDNEKAKKLKIIVPEDVDYTTVFDDVFKKYAKSVTLKKVKTTGLGSMYELTYDVIITDVKLEKQMIDEIRLRNGNLTVICATKERSAEEF